MTQSFVVHIPDADLEPEPLEPAQIVSAWAGAASLAGAWSVVASS
ncbi:cupin domain-containing protein, partial [Streptomyces sp. NPDC001215]